MRATIFGFAAAVLLCASVDARADSIPYPNPGTPNPVTYTFTAATTGDIVAYFAGSTASYVNELGLLDDGVQIGGFGLNNHASALGQSYNFGPVTAGDTLVFILHNLTLGLDAYSDPAMNLAYDFDGRNGHNHVYSTPYTATSPIIDSIPAGTFVSFEDLRFTGSSDFNYNDEDFVFTNVATGSAVPEPATMLMLGTGLVGAAWRRKAARAKSAR